MAPKSIAPTIPPQTANAVKQPTGSKIHQQPRRPVERLTCDEVRGGSISKRSFGLNAMLHSPLLMDSSTFTSD
jgi:hypothetical protein